MSRDLGIDAGDAALHDRIAAVTQEWLKQNAFLSRRLQYDAILGSDEDARSPFIREIVANNRAGRPRGTDPTA